MTKRIKVLGTAAHLFKKPLWLKSFEDTPCGLGNVVLTENEEEAKQFETFIEVMKFWKQQSKTVPWRPDGRPNRPVSAYTIEVA